MQSKRTISFSSEAVDEREGEFEVNFGTELEMGISNATPSFCYSQSLSALKEGRLGCVKEKDYSIFRESNVWI